MKSLAASALAAAYIVAMPMAHAQQGQPDAPHTAQEKITQVIVYGNDPCKAGSDNEIVVCVRQAESERYRIPKNLRGTDPNGAENQAWTNRVESVEYVGKSGTQSCSPVGGGGFTGCFAQIAQQAKAERKQMDNVSWADLVAAERARRLSTIDADSDAIEARVKAEEAERARAAEQSDAAPAASTAP